eukprot:gi/632966307/ref/XP_007899342.1/ PREDICTED: T-cell surface glycoprotein CD8 beta chain-like [Callorhinchus milii]
MDLLKKLFTLGLLLCTVQSNQFLEVVQTPEKLWQEPGGSVTMVCKFNSSSKDLRIEWNKHWPEGSLTVLTAKNKMSKAFQTYQNRTQHNFNSTFASLTISDVNPHDSGLYVCEVFIEIPSLHRDSGNGTSLQVYVLSTNTTTDSWDTRSPGPSEQPPQNEPTRWILISCVSVGAVFLLVAGFLLGRKLIAYKNRDPIYANIHFKGGQKNYRPTIEKKCDLYGQVKDPREGRRKSLNHTAH